MNFKKYLTVNLILGTILLAHVNCSETKFSGATDLGSNSNSVSPTPTPTSPVIIEVPGAEPKVCKEGSVAIWKDPTRSGELKKENFVTNLSLFSERKNLLVTYGVYIHAFKATNSKGQENINVRVQPTNDSGYINCEFFDGPEPKGLEYDHIINNTIDTFLGFLNPASENIRCWFTNQSGNAPAVFTSADGKETKLNDSPFIITNGCGTLPIQ